MKKLFSLLCLAALLFSCGGKEERPAYIPEPEGGDEVPGGTSSSKKFCVYDALSYKGKPGDLSDSKISPFRLIYEGFLLDENGQLDPAKVKTQINLTKIMGTNTVSLDIEAWYSSRDAAGLKAGLKEVFDAFKETLPGCNVGNYGIPVQDLNVLRYATPALKGASEEEVLSLWRKQSARRLDAADVCDVFYPSLYAMNPDMEQFAKDVKTTADYIRQNFPGKKIIGYVWPQYYNLQENPYYLQFIAASDWMKILEACYENLDGVVLWSHGKGEDGEDVPWADARVQTFFSTTKSFISRHWDNIVIDAGGSSYSDAGREPDEFRIYCEPGFTGTPKNLLSYGAQPVNIIKESSVSEADKVDGVLPPDLDKIRHVARNASLPVVIRQSSWITDRGTNNAAMAARFQSVYDAFKAENNTVSLGYVGIGPTALTSLAAWNNYASEFARKDSWLRYAAEPCRIIRQYTDVLYPEVTLINDDLDYWKSDCASVFEEAMADKPGGKKVIACLGATYYGNRANENCFADVFKPIKEETLTEALEYLWKHCDGILIFDNCPVEDKVAYSEDLGFMKALAKFYEKHKAVIDKTLPATVSEDADIPPYNPGSGEQPQIEYRESISNGGFEEDVTPSSTEPGVHTGAPMRPLRLAGFFDHTAKTTFPTAPAGSTVPDGAWFHRCSNNSWFWFTYIDDTTASFGASGAPIAHTGTRSAVLYSSYGAKSNHYASHADNMKHIFSLAQTLVLDDSKSYTLKFWYNCPGNVWGKDANNVSTMTVGIVSSTGADVNTDYTWEKEITLAVDGQWHEETVVFDLPSIISANPGKSFNKSAVFFGITPYRNEEGTVLKSMCNIDDVSLTNNQ